MCVCVCVCPLKNNKRTRALEAAERVLSSTHNAYEVKTPSPETNPARGRGTAPLSLYTAGAVRGPVCAVVLAPPQQPEARVDVALGELPRRGACLVSLGALLSSPALSGPPDRSQAASFRDRVISHRPTTVFLTERKLARTRTRVDPPPLRAPRSHGEDTFRAARRTAILTHQVHDGRATRFGLVRISIRQSSCERNDLGGIDVDATSLSLVSCQNPQSRP